jgi:lipopolysaccharide export system protein LptA
MKKTSNKKLIYTKEKSVLFLVLFALITPLLSYSQSTSKIKGKKVEIVHAGSLKFDKHLGNGAKRLIGDVQFKQENTLMFCDSAYFYENNSLEAFGHIHINQNDSINMYGDLLSYDGNTKKAVISKNVIVDKGDMHLTTEVLNYDMGTSVGYYTTPAKIVNKENVLTSDNGYYYAKNNDLNFKKNVVLTNPQFVINSDTMKYNTTSKITYFLGPTTIKSKENLIYCEDGWYDTKKDLSRFSKNSYILTKEQKMYGDSLYYNRKKGIGRAVKNVVVIDTAHKMDIKGDYAIHNEFTNVSIVTGNALLTQKYEKDTLYVHADTLKAIGGKSGERSGEKGEKKQETVPAKNDTVQTKKNQTLFAYHKVKFFKKDLQGKCDSLYYNLSDSTMRLFGMPTLWSEENQLTADSIKLLIGSKSIKSMDLKGNSFIVSQEDSLRFNQIRGKTMKGYFKDNNLYLVHVEGNGQTIYYAKDKQKLKAVNRADCSDLNIYLKDNKINNIVFINKPDATLYPLKQIDVKDLKLKDFSWRAKDRPLTMKDIFRW